MSRALLLVLAACGRLGFDPVPDGTAGASDGAPPAIALAHAPICADNAGGAIALAIPASIATNSGVLAFADSDGATLLDVTDDANSPWTRFTATACSAGVIYFAPHMRAGATQISLSLSAAAGAACYYELSGLDPGFTQFTVNIESGTVAGGVATGPAVTTTSAPDFIVSSLDVSSGVTAIHAGNDFTNDSLLHSDGHAHLITAAIGTFAPAWDDPAGTYTGYTAVFNAR